MAKHYENHSTVVSLVHSPEVMSHEDVKENDDQGFISISPLRRDHKQTVNKCL